MDSTQTGFQPGFLAGLIPEKDLDGVTVWRATLCTDDATGEMLFVNADGKIFWSLVSELSFWSPDRVARLHSADGTAENFFDTAQAFEALAAKSYRIRVPEKTLYLSAWLETRQYFLPSHVEMTFTFILAEDLAARRAATLATRLAVPEARSGARASLSALSAPADGLAITAFSADTNAVSLSAAWSENTVIAGGALDLFFTRTLVPPAWTNLLRGAVSPETNAWAIVIPRSVLPPAPETADAPAVTFTNIVPSAYDPNVLITNIVSTGTTVRVETGFFRLADLTDSDEDGLTDAFETWVSHTAPDDSDSDDDTLTDGWEVKYGYDPLVGNDPYADPDADGLDDFSECWYGTDPRNPDTDGDGMEDGWEIQGGLDPLTPTDPNADPDGDGLANIIEFQYRTQSDMEDSDSDGLSDLFEVTHLGEILHVGSSSQTISPMSANSDPDGDGLSNAFELLLGLDPLNADSDGDGLPDGEEAAYQNVNGNSRQRPGFSGQALDFAWVGSVATNGAVNLLTEPGALYCGSATDNGQVTAALPYPVMIGGLSVSNFAASVNGVAWLLAPGHSLPMGSYSQPVDLSATQVSPWHITAAPCWCDLTAQPYGTDTNATSVITVSGATRNGVCFNVIEWRNMGFKNRSFPANRRSFQLIIPAVPFTNLYANALFVQGLAAYSSGSGPANSTTYGCQGPQSWQEHILCFHNVSPGASFSTIYLLGTGTNPLDPDMDLDEVPDGAELAAGTNPFSKDTDGDTLPDAWEVRYAGPGIDPLIPGDPDADPDGDGLTNAEEAQHGTNPNSRDTDGDGLEDDDEILIYGTNPLSADTDGDGIDDPDEIVLGTDFLQPDSDGDTLPDGWEQKYGMNPTVDNRTDNDPGNDPLADPDGDGLTNQQESDYDTDPYDDDTDGDDVKDGTEVAQGSDPLDPDDSAPRDVMSVPFTFGDPSGSHSEKYRLIVTPVSGDPRPAQTRLNRDYGAVDDADLVLVKGAKYTVTLTHVSTSPEFMSQYGFSNYDWELDINTSQGGLVLDDPDHIVTTYIDWPNETFQAAGKHATLALLKIETQTIATQPADRTRKTIGVGEEVKLTLLPPGIGMVTWNIPSGTGQLSHYFSNGFNQYTAPAEGLDATVTASVLGGECEVDFEVIEPTDVFFENMVGSLTGGAPPVQMYYMISYYADVYILPDNVSFYRIEVCEGYAQTHTDPGYFRDYTPPHHTSWENSPRPINNMTVVSGKGTMANWDQGDTIGGVTENVQTIPPRSGHAYWDIPWKYRVANSSLKEFTIVRQDYRLTANSTNNVTFRITKRLSGAEIHTEDAAPHFIVP